MKCKSSFYIYKAIFSDSFEHYFGKLTTVSRSVAAQTVAGVVVPAVGVVRSYDHDMAGRLVRETHGGINGNVYTLETEYWGDGSLRRKRLADGTRTGLHSYDIPAQLVWAVHLFVLDSNCDAA